MLTRRTFLSGSLLGLGSLCALTLPACSNKAAGSVVTLDEIRSRGYLKAGVKTDIPGYGYQDPATGKFEGMEVEICYYLAAEILGMEKDEVKEKDLVSFSGVTAKTRGPLVDSGEVDCVVATYTISEERKKSWNFSRPYYSDSVGLLVLRSSGLKTVADLDKKVIGIGQGANTQKAIMTMLKEQGLDEVLPSFAQYMDYPTLIAALASGNIDVFAIDRSILRGYMNDSNELLQPELRFGSQDYGICTNLHAKDVADTADKLVERLLADGTMDKLIKQFKIS